jgi:ppGpp synthetase/RelA/SpoT-type nucleotidyltranferase
MLGRANTDTGSMSIEKLKSEYLSARGKAERLCESLMTQIETLVASNEIALAVPLESRVKTWDSIEEKISRKSLQLQEIADLDDLVGMRIILLFRRDIIAADKVIREHLKVLHAEDTSHRLSETQFGYQSQHYVVTLPESWLRLPSYSEFANLKVEIQLRTAAQHIWAASSHKLQYKSESSVPPTLRRSIHRVSALLETVDLEFERLLDERQLYVQMELPTTSTSEPLNVDILSRVLGELLPAKNRGTDESYADLLDDLLHFNVLTEKDLRALLKKHMSAVAEAEAVQAKGKGVDHFFVHVGLARRALRYEVGDKALNEFQVERRRPREGTPTETPKAPARKRVTKRPSAA